MLQFIRTTSDELQGLIQQAVPTYAEEMFRGGEFPDLEAAQQAANQEVHEQIYEYLYKRTHDFAHHIYTAKQQQTVCGYLWFTIREYRIAGITRPTAFLVFIFVDKAKRQQGLANQIMAFYEITARKEYGAVESTLYVSKENTIGIKLYKRFGYQIAAKGGLNQTEQTTRYKMWKRLG